jgi:hypothetical protein
MGGNDSKSESKPLSGAERADAYNYGSASIANTVRNSGAFNAANQLDTNQLGYTSPTYESLNNGDYNALEQSIINSRTAPLDTAWNKYKESENQQMADRGLWSSGMPIKEQQKYYAENFLPAYQQAGADAATQRYTMQQSDLTAKNAAAIDAAQKEYEAKWRPLDYAQGLYNQTGGVMSSGTSSGWSI